MTIKASRMLQAHFSLTQGSSRSHYMRLSGIRDKISETPFSKRIHVRSFSGRALSPAMVNALDPHSYTSGRWLRNDKHEREIRRIDLDFDNLCHRIVELSHGEKYIQHCEKKEGGFNRVFIFTMNDGSRIVARLPFKVAGPSKLTTASEVATIHYLQKNTSIPIPKTLDWSDDAANDIGSEYIIMEHAAGTPLHQKWLSMSGDQKVRCIDSIYKKLREMVDITFPGYGSLYFSTTPLEPHSKIPLDSGFCIGLHCGTRYWDCGDRRYYQHTAPNQGPCEYLPTLENIVAKTVDTGQTVNGFADGLIDAGISRIPPRDFDLPTRPSYQGSVPTHLELLKHGRQVLHAMSTDSRVHDAASPTLFHPDLHKRNIFVSDTDPSVITAIIDWQSCSIEPAFWYTDEIPDFAIHASSSISSTEKVDDSELCAKVYEAATQFLTPKLALPKSMNESMFRPFRYCYRTWKDGAVAFQHDLIETSQEWKTLGFTGACPFVLPTPKEMTLHQKEYTYFEASHNLKRDLSNLLDCATDGWVPPENWEAAKRGNKAMFEGMLQAVLTNQNPDDDEPIREEKDLREIWPFDLPRK